MRDQLTLVPCLLLSSLLALGGIASQPGQGYAQATAITSSGLGTTVTQSGTTFTITGGSRPNNTGQNLFHSFGQFSVGRTGTVNDVAKFVNDTGPGVRNILARVTGGQSSILGTITVDPATFPQANLFLLNPAGVVFGATAVLDVPGSVHVSTGNSVGFAGTDAKFYADPAKPTVLTVANPVSFGFMTANPASISVNSSQLQVASGQTLSLVGGDIKITGVTGSPTPNLGPKTGASSVGIQIASVASTTEEATVTVSPGLSTSPFSQLGAITLNNARMDVSGPAAGGPSGTIVIRGGSLDAIGTTLSANTAGNANGVRPIVDIRVTRDITLSNNARIDVSGRSTATGGPSGTIVIRGGSLNATQAALVANTTGNANGAPLAVDIEVT